MQQNQRNFRSYKYILDAGQHVTADIDGNMFAVITASSKLSLSFDESNTLKDMQQGMGGEFGSPYNKVTIKTDVPQTIVLVLGFGRLNDSRSEASTGDTNISVDKANTIGNKGTVVIPAGQASQIIAANTTRLETRLNIKDTEPGGVYLGASGVTAATGGYLDVGQTEYMSGSFAIFAFNDNPDPVSVSVIDTRKV